MEHHGSEGANQAATRQTSVGTCDLQKEGYGVITAAVFLTSTSVGANLLNVPQGMAFLGWLGLPVLAVLGFQSWFCSHLLASSWMLVETLGSVSVLESSTSRIPHLISVAVLAVDTLSSVMLLVLASDLVASIVRYVFPPAQPTSLRPDPAHGRLPLPLSRGSSHRKTSALCFFPVDRMVAVLGLSTSMASWVLLLMKLCADFCHRPSPPPRIPPSPLRMLVGMSGVTNCFSSGGVQPTIQADMRDRSAFSSALAAVFLVVSLMVSSMAATSYTLIGSEARSSIIHNMGPGRLLLAIQSLMLVHVLTSFIIYINPLYQELEEMLTIPEGSWRQYTFRSFCMCLLVLVSEALPDFSNVLDLLSVLAIIITMVVPPIMYLRLTSRPELNIKLSTTEKALLVFLVATGMVYSAASAFGATSFVFVEQQQGSCFRAGQTVKPPDIKALQPTTPASRAFIFKAQILTFKPPT
ncbi:Amino acid transporter AVT1C [Amphibalanus amphitrite]|uniref:Amino acid transporter AVT1C n=1 Tax=Amphibalanus amphitrite TaxID=1232801 RepID=A0A6A4W2S3_AMPAM|nr:Amino acid transporter AVT1C [Amphibalanus amphitrite]